MGNILSTLLYLAVMVGLTILIFIGGRKYVFSKVKINKWIPLGISLVLLASQIFIEKNNVWVTIGLTLVIVTFFLWFMDIQTTGGVKTPEKKIVIKPKAKPNRVKHLKKEDN